MATPGAVLPVRWWSVAVKCAVRESVRGNNSEVAGGFLQRGHCWGGHSTGWDGAVVGRAGKCTGWIYIEMI